jgi:hypothetical protein
MDRVETARITVPDLVFIGLTRIALLLMDVGVAETRRRISPNSAKLSTCKTSPVSSPSFPLQFVCQ